MGIRGNDGLNYSYDSEDLIYELKQDIGEFGGDMEVYAIFKWVAGIKLYVDYDFITTENPLDQNELQNDNVVEIMQAGKLMEMLKRQNDI